MQCCAVAIRKVLCYVAGQLNDGTLYIGIVSCQDILWVRLLLTTGPVCAGSVVVHNVCWCV